MKTQMGLASSIAPIRLVTEIETANNSYLPATIEDVAVGKAYATRRIILVETGGLRSGTATDAVTIGGISATKVGQVIATQGNAYSSSTVWAASVPSGTTVDIVKSGASGSDQFCINHVYVIVGGDFETPVAYTNSSATSSVAVASVPCGPSSIIIGGAGYAWGVTTNPVDTVFTNITETSDGGVNIPQAGTPVYWRGASAYRADTADAGSLTITAAYSATPTRCTACYVRFT